MALFTECEEVAAQEQLPEDSLHEGWTQLKQFLRQVHCVSTKDITTHGFTSVSPYVLWESCHLGLACTS